MPSILAVRPALSTQTVGIPAFLRARDQFARVEKVLMVAVSGYFVASLLSLLA